MVWYTYTTLISRYVVYYILFVPLWDSCYSDVVVFFFFFCSNFLSYLSSPSNFFLGLSGNFDFWLFDRCYISDNQGRFFPGRYSGIRAKVKHYLGSVAWFSRDGVSNTLDWVWVYIYEWTYLLFDIKWFYIVEIYWLSCLWILVDQFDPLYR